MNEPLENKPGPKPRLDFTRPYGIVVGDPKLAFEQDGLHFGFDHKPIERWSTPENLANEKLVRQRQQQKEAKIAMRRAVNERNRILKENDGGE